MGKGNGFDYQKIFQALSLISQLGLIIVANLAAGFFIGSLVDYYLHSGLIFRIIGLLLGIVSGFLSVYRLLMKVMDDEKNNE
ncbi:MAG TPA: AtpZ/AtpI family protein [Halanaerobiales bacterium]|nr:AtpZ/AtpI family protein [Halanaerobiales bacterium]